MDGLTPDLDTADLKRPPNQPQQPTSGDSRRRLTRATLLERRSFVLDIQDVPDRPANVRYPTRFRADYDSTAQVYKFVFSDFTAAGTL